MNDNNIGSFKILFDALTDDAVTNDLFHKFKNINHINEALCIQNTGYNALEFLAIYESIVKNNEFKMRETSNRSISQALAVYLYWWKTGSDQESIENHFGSVSRRQVSAICQQIRDVLVKTFVPENLGEHHLSRSEFLKHNTQISDRLLNLESSKLAVIADGTYCYIQKSSNFYFQRVTYSGQKKRHLVKPFVICCTDGYIIDIFGLYPGILNDATIMIDILKNESSFTSLLAKGDVFILDRGFRDCISDIEDLEFEAKMPALLGKFEKQLSAKESNLSRIVTKQRYVVEINNSFLKRSFKALLIF